jgi:excisionase family DNA binding protein
MSSTRVVVVHGPADTALEGALRSAGLVPLVEAGGATVWAAELAPAEVSAEVGRPGRRLLTITEVAEALAIGRSSVYQLIATGQLEVVHVGRSARVPDTAIDDLVDGLRYRPRRHRRRPSPAVG